MYNGWGVNISYINCQSYCSSRLMPINLYTAMYALNASIVAITKCHNHNWIIWGEKEWQKEKKPNRILINIYTYILWRFDRALNCEKQTEKMQMWTRWKEKVSKMTCNMWKQCVGYDVERETKKKRTVARALACILQTENRDWIYLIWYMHVVMFDRN